MKIKNLYKTKKPVISFEIFPPNDKYPIESIYETIDGLSKLNPDFISVTYGAGGTNQGRTLEIASKIKNTYKIESLAHLTCFGSTNEEIEIILNNLKKENIENILALRGDLPKTLIKPNGDFKYASNLIKKIKKEDNFCIGAAFYPEGHLETNDLLDLFYLKEKVKEGTDFLISQIFFDNDYFYTFKEKCDKLNITIPLIPGIIPVTNVKQIKKITELCGTTIPPKFQKILDLYKDNPEALKEAGIAYAVEQIIDLLSSGVSGIHIYTMNKVDIVKEIMNRIEKIKTCLKEVG
ncbi:methylenetetrahydrofolate reductase [NAD(P)H] [Candidatus Cetobacterium colombiensis]|jgi:methylenetetrahydrofolate reductase (NADPH)|uniref:Methylenetetrahydrofolate reductase n=1 Tax=Candidatus Cetobacterium colombiensis TaxID=3073100 RepID=A0ABU4W9E2_9FUSO|nr:methylenetetrahydrofolate reductase [NAD(P)H] [Candidatus Cetobacterium colombiensis]MDX8336133.1 methylenetetrahydrofolate reductase [NAD(P)H] [Candidatus Cetobacterium colombiensis]